MEQLKLWHPLVGVVGTVAHTQSVQTDKFLDPASMANASIGVAVVIAIAIIFISILLVVVAYKMFPENKFMHALMTLLLGLFWLIPAMFYYLFYLKGYHMSGIRIVKRV